MVDITDGIAKDYISATKNPLQNSLESIPIAQSAQLLAKKAQRPHCQKHSAMAKTMNCYSRSTIQFKAHSLKVIGSNSFLKHLTKIGTIVEKNPLGNIIDSVSKKPIDDLKSFDHFNEIVSIPRHIIMSSLLTELNKGIQTSNPEETVAIGEQLAKELPADASLALYGDLGVGKTTLVKGIAKGLGITKNITSPPSIYFQSTRRKTTSSSGCLSIESGAID